MVRGKKIKEDMCEWNEHNQVLEDYPKHNVF